MGTKLNYLRKGTTSFYDWCIENNRNDLLDRWDYELNDKNPKEVAYRSNYKFYFKCKNGHESELFSLDNGIKCNANFKCRQCDLDKNNFEKWCIDNNKQDILDRWDYELNNKLPKNIKPQSNGKFYFKCQQNKHKSELYILSDITLNTNKCFCRKCNIENNNFEKWCLENNKSDLLNRWDYELNLEIPKDIFKKSNKKFYFKCLTNKNHKSEFKKIDDVVNKSDGSSRCNQCNSFAQWGIDNICEDFLEKYWDYDKNVKSPWDSSRCSNNKIWIKCQDKDYHDSYEIIQHDFVNGNRCPYCRMLKIHPLDSLGSIYPESIELWSDKNEKSPYGYSTQSNCEVLWQCKNNLHDEYKRSIYSSLNCDFRCPECVRERDESFLQEKVRLYVLEELGYKLNHERNCSIIAKNYKTNRKMPYDNEVIDLKLIIETMGIQHYEIGRYSDLQSKHSKLSSQEELEYQQWKDEIKKQYVLSQGYNYLAIPYWTEKDESYKTLIDEKIKEILKGGVK